MATTQFAFTWLAPGAIPAANIDQASCESKTPSASAQATTAAATANHSICRVSTDTQVMVSFGSSPDASTDAKKFLLPAGAVEYFQVLTGWKGSVVTA